MSVVTFPSTLYARSMNWSQMRNDTTFRSAFGSQAIEVTSPLWQVSLEGSLQNDSSAGEWKALLLRLRGSTNQLELWDPMRPVPVGTMRGTMTFNAAPVAGATSLSVTAGGGQAAKTLLKGDLIGVGSGLTQQVVMVTGDATANGSGVIALTVEPPLRNAFLIGDAVTWDHPKALFRRANSKMGWDYTAMRVSGFVLELVEDWRP